MKSIAIATLLLLPAGAALAGGRATSPALREYQRTVKLVKSGYDGVLHPDAGDMGYEIRQANAESIATRGRPLSKATERAMWRTGLVIDMQHGLADAKYQKAKIFDRYAIFGVGFGLDRALSAAKQLRMPKAELHEYLRAFGLDVEDIAKAKKAGVSFH